MHYYNTPGFDKDFKKLRKKYRSLSEDIVILKKVLDLEPRGHWSMVVPMSYAQVKPIIPAYKVKEFRCRALGGGSRSGIRIIYSYHESKQAILFIEIYYKERRDTDCNIARLKKYCENDWALNFC